MIVTVPAETPITTPEVDPTVAIAVLLLLHVPPLVESCNTTYDPTQVPEAPVIEDIDVEEVTVK